MVPEFGDGRHKGNKGDEVNKKRPGGVSTYNVYSGTANRTRSSIWASRLRSTRTSFACWRKHDPPDIPVAVRNALCCPSAVKDAGCPVQPCRSSHLTSALNVRCWHCCWQLVAQQRKRKYLPPHRTIPSFSAEQMVGEMFLSSLHRAKTVVIGVHGGRGELDTLLESSFLRDGKMRFHGKDTELAPHEILAKVVVNYPPWSPHRVGLTKLSRDCDYCIDGLLSSRFLLR
ncbi:hypothetical protein V8F20_003795 [Naviculisporaceae sp. PSN 640]